MGDLPKNERSPLSSKMPAFIYAVIILAFIPLGLFIFSNNNSISEKFKDLTNNKNKWQEEENKSFTVKYPTGFKAEKFNPKADELTILAPEKNELIKISASTTDAKTFEAKSEVDKNDADSETTSTSSALQTALDFGINRERLYYSDYKGRTKINGFDALIYETDKPRDPETQKELPPYKSYVIYAEDEVDGNKVIKITRISYFAGEKNAEVFEKMISELVLKN